MSSSWNALTMFTQNNNHNNHNNHNNNHNNAPSAPDHGTMVDGYDRDDLKSKLLALKRKMAQEDHHHHHHSHMVKHGQISLLAKSSTDQESSDSESGVVAANNNNNNTKTVHETALVVHKDIPVPDCPSILSFCSSSASARDFDENPTELYNALNEKNWDQAMERLEDAPEESTTWIYRMDEDNVRVRWRILPLHASIILSAPNRVVESLVMTAPNTVRMKDDEGSLPLHLACKVGASVSIVRLLLNSYPESVGKVDGDGESPIEIILESEHENSNQVQWLLEQYHGMRGIRHAGTADTKESKSEGSVSELTDPKKGELGCISELTEPKKGEYMESEPPPPPPPPPLHVEDLSNERRRSRRRAKDPAEESKTEIPIPSMTQIDHLMLIESLQEAFRADVKEVTCEFAEKAEADHRQAARLLEWKLQRVLERQRVEIDELRVASLEGADCPEFMEQIALQLRDLEDAHRHEVELVKEKAKRSQDLKREDDTNRLKLKLKEMEELHKKQLSKLTNPGQSNEELERMPMDTEMKQTNHFDGQHKADLFSESLVMYDQAFNEMQTQYRDQIHADKDCDGKESVLKKLRELEHSFRVQTLRSERDYKKSIEEIHSLINDIQAEMIAVNLNTSLQTKDVQKAMKDLEARLRGGGQAHKIEQLEKTVFILQAKLDETRRESRVLYDRLAELEERFEEQDEREELLLQKLTKLESSKSMGMFFM